MEAGVPFALVAGVQVVAFAAALGLAATGAVAAYRRDSRALLAAGGLLLAVAHSVTVARLGSGSSDALAAVRAAGYALVAGGVVGFRVVALPVVVPLGAAAGAAVLAAGGAVAAAVATVRVRRPGGRLLALGFVLAAASEALAPAARTRQWAAVAMLVLRGGWAVATTGFVARVAQTRLLSKVVGAILAAVLLLAAGSALVVGTVATRVLSRDTAAAIQRVAQGQVEAFRDAADVAQSFALVVSRCRPGDRCGETLQFFGADPNPITARVRRGKPVPESYSGLSRLEAYDLAQSSVVQEALRSGTRASTLGVVLGGAPKLVAFGVTPRSDHPQRRPAAEVYVYGSVIGQDRVDRIKAETDFDATIFVGRAAVVSSVDGAAERDRIVAEHARSGAAASGGPGVTVPAEGDRPAVRFEPLRDARGETIAVLALSAESNVILGTQRSVLGALFGGTLVIGLLVGLLAVLLGRRIVRPVQQLTVAAARIRAGDLDVRTEVRTSDELGLLARSFDAMTASLASSREELVRAAEEEAALRGRLQAVLNSMGDGLLTTDADGVVTGVNPAAATMLGADDEDLVGRPAREVLAGTDATGAPLVTRLDRMPAVRAGLVRARDGRPVPVVLVLTPLRGTEGHVVVVRDTSREREVERMKTEFLSNVSHELRTPLTPIRGYAEILQRRPDLPAEKMAEYAASIVESSVRMSRVVDLLVDVASLEAGRVEAAAEPVSPRAFLEQRREAWQRREPNREFRRRVAAGLPAMLADPGWLAKAYDELVDNAVKYSTGPITLVAAATGEGRVRLTVRDAGTGIADEHRSRLFAPFEQVDGSATRSVGGLGLGLSFVRRVCDDFGLDVVVESTVGKGSAFSLDVPVVEPARRPPRRGARRAPGSRPQGRSR